MPSFVIYISDYDVFLCIHYFNLKCPGGDLDSTLSLTRSPRYYLFLYLRHKYYINTFFFVDLQEKTNEHAFRA